MNSRANNLREYLDELPAESAGPMEKVLALMKKLLPGAQQRIQWGIAIFALSGKDVIGIAARTGFYSLYVPHGATVKKYAPRLGKVSAGKGCIRFKNLNEVDLGELEKMVKEMKRKVSSRTQL